MVNGVIKLIDTVLLILLFLWFTLIMTGFKVGSTIICTSAVRDKSIPEIIMWTVLLALIPIYTFTSIIGNIAVVLFLLLWIIAQYFFTLRFVIFPNTKKIQVYNRHFADTHHIIKPSNKRLVPDTYHIVLFIMLFTCLFVTIANLLFSITQHA